MHPAAPPSPRNAPARLAYLDWLRGLAVVIMLQGHVFQSFSRTGLRGQGPYVLSQLFGGQGPAIFLFLTGITLAFLIERRERQGLGPLARWNAAWRRALYLWMLAFLFRAQLWLFAYPGSNWTDLFKIDILNSMGFAIAIFSLTALLRIRHRARVCAIVGAAIALASPLVSSAGWSWLPPGLNAYIVPNYATFAFFPWASFIAFGISAGCILRLAGPDQTARLVLWSAIGGLLLIIGGEYFSNVPYSVYPSSEYWLNSPGLIAVKLGVILIAVAFAWLWCEHARPVWSVCRQLGTTSLIVYWVHIELVYGRWSGAWRESFTAVQCALASAALIALMVCVSIARSDWPRLATRFRFKMPAILLPVPLKSQRISGD